MRVHLGAGGAELRRPARLGASLVGRVPAAGAGEETVVPAFGEREVGLPRAGSPQPEINPPKHVCSSAAAGGDGGPLAP